MEKIKYYESKYDLYLDEFLPIIEDHAEDHGFKVEEGKTGLTTFLTRGDDEIEPKTIEISDQEVWDNGVDLTKYITVEKTSERELTEDFNWKWSEELDQYIDKDGKPQGDDYPQEIYENWFYDERAFVDGSDREYFRFSTDKELLEQFEKDLQKAIENCTF